MTIDPSDTVRSYLREQRPTALSRLRGELERAPEESLRALVDLVQHREFTHPQAVGIGCDLGKRAGEAVVGFVLRAFLDSDNHEDTRRLALDLLAARKTLPPWAQLNEIARHTPSDSLRAACLHHCEASRLSAKDREGFVEHLERWDNPESILAALPLVKPLFSLDSSHEIQERLFARLVENLPHPDDRVRRDVFEILSEFGRLEWIECIRLFSPNAGDSEFQKSVEALVVRIWKRPIDMRTLSPNGFEHFTRRWLRAHAYTKVEVTGRVGDDGIDLRCRFNGEDCVVQCKRWTTQPVSDDLVRELLVSAGRTKALAVFVTTSTFTECALKVRTEQKSLRLIDGRGLIHGASRAWGEGGVTLSKRANGESATLPLDYEQWR